MAKETILMGTEQKGGEFLDTIAQLEGQALAHKFGQMLLAELQFTFSTIGLMDPEKILASSPELDKLEEAIFGEEIGTGKGKME
jgi:hypothetical protein